MAWGIRLRNKITNDPFLAGRLRMTFYYLAFCTVVFWSGSFLVDHYAHTVLLQAFADPAARSPEEVMALIDESRMKIRIFYVIVFSLGAYVLMGEALRPVREALESERRFIANVSHELRTPLTLAKAETEVLLKKPELLDLTRATAALRKNLTEIDHVSRIIQFLLVLSDFNGQKGTTTKQQVPLSQIVRAAEAQSARLLNEKKVRLLTAVPEGDTRVRGNAIALEKLLLNLVRNAAIYSPEGSTIEVSVARTGSGKLLLAVRDYGIGIPASEHKHIFKPFYRGMNASPGGTGLGLAIVQEVVRLHNARIRVDSVEGKGSTFTIEFS